MYVTELDPKTGEEKEFACYDKDGKIDYAGKLYKNKNGNDEEVTKSFEDGDIYINEHNSKLKLSKHIHIGKDKKVIEYEESRETPRGVVTRSVEFYNGMPLRIDQSTRLVVPNIISAEPMTDPDLTPAKPLNMKALLKDIIYQEGSETFFSNGKLESKTAIIDGVEYKAFYNPDSLPSRLVLPDKEIEFAKKSYTIKENLGEGKEKETYLSENTIRVTHKDNNFSKNIIIDRKTNLPLSYHESKEIDGVEKDVKSIYFNNTGFAESVYES